MWTPPSDHPPLTRGKLKLRHNIARHRITPAYAGKILKKPLNQLFFFDPTSPFLFGICILYHILDAIFSRWKRSPGISVQQKIADTCHCAGRDDTFQNQEGP